MPEWEFHCFIIHVNKMSVSTYLTCYSATMSSQRNQTSCQRHASEGKKRKRLTNPTARGSLTVSIEHGGAFCIRMQDANRESMNMHLAQVSLELQAPSYTIQYLAFSICSSRRPVSWRSEIGSYLWVHPVKMPKTVVTLKSFELVGLESKYAAPTIPSIHIQHIRQMSWCIRLVRPEELSSEQANFQFRSSGFLQYYLFFSFKCLSSYELAR